MRSTKEHRTAIVLSGGGTRGAYEVGVLSYIRSKLPPTLAEKLVFNIQCGSSVGAINAAVMVSRAHDPLSQGKALVSLWENIRTENIYRRGPFTLGKLLLRMGIGTTSKLVGLKGVTEADDDLLSFHGLFDTTPFFQTLMRACSWANISRNIDRGPVASLIVPATNMVSGQVEFFLEKKPSITHSDRLVTHVGRISPRHVMASAALPVLFPPVPIRHTYYNDGGMRLNTPIGPAVSLGATHVLTIGTRRAPQRPRGEATYKSDSHKPPSLASVLGKFYNAVLLDRLEADNEQLERINRILKSCEEHTTPLVFEEICQEAKVHPIETLFLSPTVDIATLVDDTLRSSLRKLKTFGVLERAILRILEVDVASGSDFLSYFLFEPEYIKRLIDLGFQDARKQHDQLVDFAEKAIG